MTAGRNPLVPINSPFDASTLEKKFNSGALVSAGLESHLDPDRSRQNAITNLSQAIQQQLNSERVRNRYNWSFYPFGPHFSNPIIVLNYVIPLNHFKPQTEALLK